MAASKVNCRAPMVLMLNTLVNRERCGDEGAGRAGEAIMPVYVIWSGNSSDDAADLTALRGWPLRALFAMLDVLKSTTKQTRPSNSW